MFQEGLRYLTMKVLDLLKEISMSGCKLTDTLIGYNLKLGKNYKGTPLYIAFVVSLVSQFMHFPYEKHLEVVYEIIRYFKSILRKGLLFKKNEQQGVKNYTNTNWVKVITDRRFTFKYYMFV